MHSPLRREHGRWSCGNGLESRARASAGGAGIGEAGIAHPETRLVTAVGPVGEWAGPVVVKPRFGSWGTHVVRCDSESDLRSHLGAIADLRWFRFCGASII